MLFLPKIISLFGGKSTNNGTNASWDFNQDGALSDEGEKWQREVDAKSQERMDWATHGVTGAGIGAGIGTVFGILGGPFAPITVPLGAGIGGLVGFGIGSLT